jgi:hypothetical protein
MIHLHTFDFAKLLETFLHAFPGVEVENVFAKRLSGGLSGAVVGLAWSDGLPPLIVKLGPARHIRDEHGGRELLAGSNPNVANMVAELRKVGLDGVSEALDVNLGTRSEPFAALVYLYRGSLNPATADEWIDFQAAFEGFVEGKYSEVLLRRWLERLAAQVRIPGGVAARPLQKYIPPVGWNEFVTPILNTAAAFLPRREADELRGLETWWHKAIGRGNLNAAVPDEGPIHGDFRFANILLEPTTSRVEVIDFGSAHQGHVFYDLAKFECDLLLRITPSNEFSRAETLAAAARNGLVQTNASGNRQLDALHLLRETYDNRWHFTADRFSMYRWFLLAELLKRLRWFEEVFTSCEGRIALLRAILFIKRALSGDTTSVAPFATLAVVDDIGCVAAYVPASMPTEVNRRRNESKHSALHGAKDVRLLAETGNAFLHCINQKGAFFEDVHSLLKGGGSFRAVIANPYFIEGYGISNAFGAGHRVGHGIHETLIEKFLQSRRGYDELRRDFGDRIGVRVAKYGLGSSLLLVGSKIFLEPYFYVDRGHRARHQFDTFELELEPPPDAARLFQSHFEFHWSQSIPLEHVEANKETFLSTLDSILALFDGPPK